MDEKLLAEARNRERHNIWENNTNALASLGFSDPTDAMREDYLKLNASKYEQFFGAIGEDADRKESQIQQAHGQDVTQLETEELLFNEDLENRRSARALESEIKEDNLQTKEKQNELSDDFMDTQFEELSLDVVELENKRLQLDIAKEKAQLEIEGTEMQIQAEELDQAMAAIDVLEVEIRLTKNQQEIIKARLEGEHLELEKSNIDLAIAESILRQADIENDIVNIQMDILGKDLIRYRLQVDQKEYAFTLDTINRRLTAGLAKITEQGLVVADEQSHTIEQTTQEELSYVADKAALDNRLVLTQAEGNIEMDNISWMLAQERSNEALEEFLAALKETSEYAITDKQLAIDAKRKQNAQYDYEIDVTVAQEMAEAEVTSTLTHTIGEA